MIKLALPKGALQHEIADLLEAAGLPLPAYRGNSRDLHVRLNDPDISVRIFQERDIPIQIALGNYDLGICRLSWIEELLCRFPSEAIVKLVDLGVGREELFVAHADTLPDDDHIRIVSEFGNIAEAVAMHARLPAYRNFAVWGAVDAYPPEDADLVILAAPTEAGIEALGLRPVWHLLSGSAWLIANRESLAQKDLRPVLGAFARMQTHSASDRSLAPPPRAVLAALPRRPARRARDSVRLALPDGHAQTHTIAAVADAGLHFDGYTAERTVRRPLSTIEGLEVKVIRPQDMPQQVALGHFDLAITGRDWLQDHLFRFPSSPVEEVADLGRSRYEIAAAVAQELPARNLREALESWRSQGRQTIRIASEYAHIADEYARYRHFGMYRVIPITGASEGFVPEDAELLIEGTETGSSFKANRLRAIDTLFISTNCLIANKRRPDGARGRLINELIERFRAVVPAAV